MIGFSRPLKHHRARITGSLVALLLLLTALPAAVFAQDVCAGTLTKLSACTRDANGNITIGPDGCTTVYADESFTGANAFALIKVQQNGALCIRDSDVGAQNLQISTTGIIDQGVFAIGSKATPIGTGSINGTVTINFTGSRDSSGGPTDTCPDPNFRKGIEVCGKATLRLYGVKGVPVAGSSRTDGTHTSWTFLSQPAGDPSRFSNANGLASPVLEPDARTIDVADPVDWQTGDWIVIATTSYSPFESEFVQIASVSSNHTHITLNNPLVFYHFGGTDPGTPSLATLTEGISQNYGVDERAEVGLISRNIKLTATIPSNDAKSLHWGGEIIIRKNFTEASIQGVELEKFGKDRLGSYPIHLHKDGVIANNQTLLVSANSIHHSYNKCITVHSTVNAAIANNVCARAVGHLFYEEIGNEEHIAFNSNLGLGAMSNSFDIDGTSTDSATRAAQRTALIQQYWWPGDYLTNDPQSASYNGYDGFNIANPDNQSNPTHGSCVMPDPSLKGNVIVEGSQTKPCGPKQFYYEPASGFWIINPATHLQGNAIGGCQGDGKGYWYVPPTIDVDSLTNPGNKFTPKYQSVDFSDNRVHACESGVYGEGEFGIISDQMFPLVGGKAGGLSMVTTFDGIISARNRNRGVWLRPNWFDIKNSRFAMNRDNATLVTAGGFDGASPGDWGLVRDSTFVGISTNNVDRFGPCPYPGLNGAPPTFQSGGQYGCIDLNPAANDIVNLGYPFPTWNFAGYYTYDGPARIFNDHFVNFVDNVTTPVAPYWTAFDQAYFNWFVASGRIGGPYANKYEGDAAIGWFNSNQSSYPVSTIFDNLTFEDVDLRHQVFTDLVNFGNFNDGDKNTAIVDRDGSLTGYSVLESDGATTPSDVFPISLNNLGFNYTSNSADECLSEGAQNAAVEGRPTSVISPGDIGSLEFEALWPTPDKDEHIQWIKFTTDDQFGVTGDTTHQTMFLHGRNGLGVWEPKVASGHGYTISVPSSAPSPSTIPQPADAGIPRVVDVGVTDARLGEAASPSATPTPAADSADAAGTADAAAGTIDAPNASAIDSDVSQPNPFLVRMGICYGNSKNNNGGSLTSNNFTVQRGYKTWGGGLGGTDEKDPTLAKYWSVLDCHNLDSQLKKAGKDYTVICPASSVAPVNPFNNACDPDSTGKDDQGNCIYPKTTLTAVDCATLASSPSDKNYCYNPSTGYLYFYIKQSAVIAQGPSPLGDCLNPSQQSGCNAACPAGQYQSPVDCSCSTQNPCPNPNSSTDPFGFAESYYSCPNEGCPLYQITVKNSVPYTPGPSTCADPYSNSAVPPPLAPPSNENQLAVSGTPVVQNVVLGLDNLPHAQPVPTPNCSQGLPGATPPWFTGPIPPPQFASYVIFNQVTGDASVTIGGASVYTTNPFTQFVATNLTFNQTYTLQVVRPTGTCTSSFTTGGTSSAPTFTVNTSNNQCNIIPTTGGTTALTLLTPTS